MQNTELAEIRESLLELSGFKKKTICAWAYLIYSSKTE